MNRKTALENQLLAISEQLGKLADRPTEPQPDEDGANIIWFKKRFSQSSGRAYTYCAVQAAGKWYLSGARNVMQGVSWDVLMDWIFAQHDADPHSFSAPVLWTATDWEEVQ